MLDAAVDAALPLDDERRTDWRVYLAYMGAAVGEPELDALLRDRQRRFADTLADAVRQAVASRRFGRRSRPEHEAERLMVVLNGIAVHAVFDPARWGADAQRRIVDDHLRPLTRRSR